MSDDETGHVRIMLEIYAEGRFFEPYELSAFPFDAQDLTFTLTLNVQVAGPMGVKLIRSSDGSTSRGFVYEPVHLHGLQRPGGREQRAIYIYMAESHWLPR